jgi:hypothetical protein
MRFGTIAHCVDVTPFEQVFYFVETFPKLGSKCIPRSEEDPMPHVFSFQEPSPKAVLLLIHFSNLFGHQVFIKNMSIYNPRPPNCFGLQTASHLTMWY